jgi:hypothetical protein
MFRLSSIYWSNTYKRMNLWTYDGYRDTKHYIVDTAMKTKSRLSSIYWSNTYKYILLSLDFVIMAVSTM